jgi:rhodanese-related sulfurtransferase
MRYDDLWVSASKQPSEAGIRWLKEEAKKANKTLHIIDLRAEPHFFIEKQSLTYYSGLHNDENANLSLKEILEKESQMQRALITNKTIDVYKKYIKIPERNFLAFEGQFIMPTSELQTEEELIRNLKEIRYTRIPFTDHDIKQMAEQIGTIVEIVQKALEQKNVWIHFHCHGGKARSATAVITTHLFIKGSKDIEIKQALNELFLVEECFQERKKYRKIAPYIGAIYNTCLLKKAGNNP